jgi:hypothetical protein
MPKKQTEIKYNPVWDVKLEYVHGKDLIVPGTLIKIKNVRGEFKFEKYVKNKDSGMEWIDVIGSTGYRSFYLWDLKGIIKPKKKRVSKNVNGD